jgi:cytoskeletal protein RodZ
MNKGYAFGFLIVLLVVALGFYVALTGFLSTRETLKAQSTTAPPTEASAVAQRPTSPPPTASPTEMPSIPTSFPGITTTLTEVALPTEAGAPAATEAVTSGPTEPPTPLPTQPMPTETAGGQAPPTPGPSYQFRLEGPPVPDPGYPTCCYIYGTVWDQAGLPLEGIQVVAANEWIRLDPALTKGGGEAGQYNIPLGRDVVTWELMIVDAGGNQISTKATLLFDPSMANGYRIDWQRTY